tara:strand:+ start:1235 stop:1690 length:456 start_codon:yes stop_codon:yes gene_type:complete
MNQDGTKFVDNKDRKNAAKIEEDGFYLEQQAKSPPQPPPKPPPPPTMTQTISSRDSKYESPLLKKYKFENGRYHSITTGSMFENMISCVPGGGCFEALDVWKTEHFVNVRAIDDKIRKKYRESSGGHSGYTFHSLSSDEMHIFCNCLKNAI